MSEESVRGKERGWQDLRLSTRLALLVFGMELLLLSAFALTTYFFSEKQFTNSFDLTLRTRAEAMISMIEPGQETGVKLTPQSLEALARYLSDRREKDLLAIMGPDGRVVWKSKGLEKLPGFALREDEKAAFKSFRYGGKDYRGVRLSHENDNKIAPWFRDGGFAVFLASNSRKMEGDLEDITEFLVWSVSGLLLVSGSLVGVIARRGFAPVRKLARQTDKIGETNLHVRLAADSMPPELAPMARAINGLLERLERAFERQKQFSADAAHELRTPVAALKSGVQAALLSPRNKVEDQAVLEDLLEEISRLENLCESLLLIASSKSTTETSPSLPVTDWIACIAAAVEDLSDLAAERSCAIRFGGAASLPDSLMLQTDEQATRRIVTNLAENAIRHSGGARVEVRVSLDDGSPRLLVEDDGEGITAEDEGRLFDRFFRADSARSRDSGGTGLGLAICRALAESSGGAISYERRSPRGNCFVWRVALAGEVFGVLTC